MIDLTLIVLAALIIGGQLVCILAGVEAWPFSCYPMFAERLSLNEVEVFRVAVRRATGEMFWWAPPFPGLLSDFDALLAHTLATMEDDEEVGRERLSSLMAEILRLVRLDGDPDNPERIYVVRRTVEKTESGTFRFHNQTILVYG